MEDVVANVRHMKFDIEISLEQQHGALPLPFPGMDKSVVAVCEFYAKSTCVKGSNCPFRHVRGDRTIVCKHWLRGLCKKGDYCEFLHEYDMTKMPECYFYSRFNACHNKECPFLHIDPDSKLKDCPWYDRGFCRHGPTCRHRHVRRVLCLNYFAGFCPDGPSCKFIQIELPAAEANQRDPKKLVIVCHFCGDTGHKALFCQKVPQEDVEAAALKENTSSNVMQADEPRLGYNKSCLKPLREVTCFKCGNKGHYANKCPRGHLAFLAMPLCQNEDLENL